MADRVKYFILGLLLLVVGGVIAFDRWNNDGDPSSSVADKDSGRYGDETEGDGWDVDIGPVKKEDVKPRPPVDPNHGLRINPRPEPTPEPDPQPQPQPEPQPKPPAPKPEPAPRKVVHVVKSGDNLEKISMRYYKSRNHVQRIVNANGLRNPNEIFINQKLIIPALKETTPAVRPPSTTPDRPSGRVPSTYRVKSSDKDLYAICRRFYGRRGEGARVARVMELNQLYSADVRAGTLLKLPPK